MPDRSGAQTADMFAQLDDNVLEGLDLDASVYVMDEDGALNGDRMEVDDSGFAEGGLPAGWNEVDT